MVEIKTLLVEASPFRYMAVKSLGKLWPGVVFSRVSTLRYLDVDLPDISKGWVRVKNNLSGICGSDLHLIFMEAHLGVHPTILPGNRVKYLGHELVGEVLEAGPNSRFKPGDRVIRQMRVGGGSCLAHGLEPCRSCSALDYNHCERTGLSDTVGGGFGAELVSPEGGLLAVADQLTDEQAVLVEPAACAIRGVLRRPPAGNQDILVFGTGTIGFFVIQAVKIVCPQCRVVAIAQFEYQRDLALCYGADEVWMTDQDLFEKSASRTGGRVFCGVGKSRTLMGGFDTVFDCVGSSGSLQTCLRLAKSRGNVLLIGVSIKPMTVDLTPVWYNEVNLVGTVSHGHSFLNGDRVGDYELAIRWMLEGKLITDGFITHRFKLGDYREAIGAAVNKRSSRSVKVAFEF